MRKKTRLTIQILKKRRQESRAIVILHQKGLKEYVSFLQQYENLLQQRVFIYVSLQSVVILQRKSYRHKSFQYTKYQLTIRLHLAGAQKGGSILVHYQYTHKRTEKKIRRTIDESLCLVPSLNTLLLLKVYRVQTVTRSSRNIREGRPSYIFEWFLQWLS